MIQSPNTPRFFAFMLIVMSLLSVPASATQPGSGMNHLSAQLMTSDDLIPGETTILGLKLSIDKGWHTYWPGINDTGYGVSIEIEPVDGLTFHEPVFPTPIRYIAAGNILDHTYEGEVTILVPVTVDDSLEAGISLEVNANIDYLICKEVCIPESTTAGLTMQISSTPRSESGLSIFESAYRDRPLYVGINKPIVNDPITGETYAPRLNWNKNEVTLKIDGATHYKFFPDDNCSPPLNLLAQGEAKGESITISFDRQYEDDPSAAARLSGRLSAKFKSGWRDFDIEFTQPLKQETTP